MVFSQILILLKKLELVKDTGKIAKKIRAGHRYGKNSLLDDTQLCFIQFYTRMVVWLPLTFSICLHNQLSSIHSVIVYLRVRMFEKGDSSKRQ